MPKTTITVTHTTVHTRKVTDTTTKTTVEVFTETLDKTVDVTATLVETETSLLTTDVIQTSVATQTSLATAVDAVTSYFTQTSIATVEATQTSLETQTSLATEVDTVTSQFTQTSISTVEETETAYLTRTSEAIVDVTKTSLITQTSEATATITTSATLVDTIIVPETTTYTSFDAVSTDIVCPPNAEPFFYLQAVGGGSGVTGNYAVVGSSPYIKSGVDVVTSFTADLTSATAFTLDSTGYLIVSPIGYYAYTDQYEGADIFFSTYSTAVAYGGTEAFLTCTIVAGNPRTLSCAENGKTLYYWCVDEALTDLYLTSGPPEGCTKVTALNVIKICD